MTDDRFLSVVRAQAQARVELDLQTFIGYLLPEAIEAYGGQLRGDRRQAPIIAKEYAVLEAENDENVGSSTVRYSGAGSFVLRQKWQRVSEAWRVTSLERPPELVVGPTFFQRLQRLPQMFRTPRMASRPPGGMGRR